MLSAAADDEDAQRRDDELSVLTSIFESDVACEAFDDGRSQITRDFEDCRVVVTLSPNYPSRAAAAVAVQPSVSHGHAGRNARTSLDLGAVERALQSQAAAAVGSEVVYDILEAARLACEEAAREHAVAHSPAPTPPSKRPLRPSREVALVRIDHMNAPKVQSNPYDRCSRSYFGIRPTRRQCVVF